MLAEQTEHKHLAKHDQGVHAWRVSYISGLTALFVYICTLPPTFTFGDSGEFIAAAYTLGIPHQPGYPLYVLIGKTFLSLPLPGDISWRMNLLSAVFGALAVTLSCRLFLDFIRRVYPKLDHRKCLLIAASAALILAFTPSFWLQAVIAEIYTLHLLLLVGTLYLLERWGQTNQSRYLKSAAFVMGLDTISHYSSAVVWPVLLWRIWYLRQEEKHTLSLRMAIRLAGLVVLGMTPILIVYIRALTEPLLETLPINSFRDFTVFVLSGSGGDWRGPGLTAAQLIELLKLTAPQTFIVFVFIAIAIVDLRKQDFGSFNYAIGGGGLIMIASLLILTQTLSPNQRTDIPSFLLPCLPFLFCAAVAGMASVFGWLKNFLIKRPGCYSMRYAYCLILLAVPLVEFNAGWKWCNRKNDVSARHFAECMLESLPKGAVAAPIEDSTCFPLYVLLWIEERRPDLLLWPIIPASPRHAESLLNPQNYPPSVQGRRVFTDLTPTTWTLAERMIPGLPLHELLPQTPIGDDAKQTAQVVPLDSIDNLIAPVHDFLANDQPGNTNHWARRVYGALYTTQGLFLERAQNQKEAARYFRAALKIDPAQADALQRLADWAVTENKLIEAQNYLDRLFELDSSISEAWVTKGRLQAKQNEPYEAIGSWEKARLLDADNLRSRQFLLHIYENLNETEAAAECKREIQEIQRESQPITGQ